ncbi:hypothetical protein [Rhabdothermincola salaria]|uniref:hypothetical protein n=1 Tax=Rhabdothermincola salaria TaxID=2903142 RepID=UPI001E553C52|nr:hypothetical protein [Rhabdothermincola salaria]MCD9625633.1 hypothetical protein [Rhabdothermincola salaria]
MNENQPETPSKAPSVSRAKADLYRLAYTESRARVHDQTEELSTMKQRAVQFVAFIGASTAFLVGSVVGNSGSIGAGGQILAGVATVFLIGMLASLTLLLWPGKWSLSVQAQPLLTDWIDSDIHPPGPAIYKELAEEVDKKADGNELELGRRRWLYVAAILCGMGQLALWIALGWLTLS